MRDSPNSADEGRPSRGAALVPCAILLAVLVAWSVGCRTGGPPPTPERTPGALHEPVSAPAESAESRPASGASGFSVADVACGDEYDARAERLTHRSDVFARDTGTIYVVVHMRGVAEPGRIAARWEHLDSSTRLAERTLTLAGPDVEARFSLSRPTAGWPEGRYKLYVAVNGEDVVGVPFRVAADGPSEEQRAGPR